MLKDLQISEQLIKVRTIASTPEDALIEEARRILRNDLLQGNRILQNLQHYIQSFEFLDEEDLDASLTFTPSEIKQTAIVYRLKFLDSTLFQTKTPYEARDRVEELNQRFHKELNQFKILTFAKAA